MIVSVLEDRCVGNDKGGFPVHIKQIWDCDNLIELSEICCSNHITIARFNNFYRHSNNWISNDYLAVDFDDGTLYDDIHNQLVKRSINHLILASKNHERDKGDGNGILQRFHVFMPFNESVTGNPKLYSFIAVSFCKEMDWKADLPTTKDKTRYFWKHREILKVYESGNNININQYQYGEEVARESMKIQNIINTKRYPPVKRNLDWIRHSKYWKNILSDLRTKGKRHNTSRKAFWFLIKNGIDKYDAVNFVISEMGPEDIENTEKNLSAVYDYMKGII